MKTFYFEFSSGYVGGSGVVVAKNRAEALEKANEAIMAEPLNKEQDGIKDENLVEVPKGTCKIIANGDY